MEVIHSSKMSGNFHWTTWRYIPEHRTLHCYQSKNLNSNQQCFDLCISFLNQNNSPRTATHILHSMIHKYSPVQDVSLSLSLRGFVPLANYSDRATAACWRSSAKERVAWSAQRIPPVVVSVFLTGAATISFKMASACY
jgi:hypothetical protein